MDPCQADVAFALPAVAHVAKRLTVISQMAKGLGRGRGSALATEVAGEVERLWWFLWTATSSARSLVVEDLEVDLDIEEAGLEGRKLAVPGSRRCPHPGLTRTARADAAVSRPRLSECHAQDSRLNELDGDYWLHR